MKRNGIWKGIAAGVGLSLATDLAVRLTRPDLFHTAAVAQAVAGVGSAVVFRREPRTAIAAASVLAMSSMVALALEKRRQQDLPPAPSVVMS